MLLFISVFLITKDKKMTAVLEKTVVIGTSGKKSVIVKSIGRALQFNLYECVFDDNRLGIFKIASDAAHNDALDREALILRFMDVHAADLDTCVLTPEGKLPHYGVFFPQLIESFIVENQDGRRANVLKFADSVQKLEDLTTISGLCEVEQVRVDPRTGAWILGKLLKILSFAHGIGISNGRRITTDNILIERELHGLLVFDWSSATLHSEGVVPRFIASEELSLVGLVAIEVLGGDPDTGAILEDDQLRDDRFQEFIRRLANGMMFDASRAHHEFYDLIWTLWPRGFHPFTAYAKKGGAR